MVGVRLAGQDVFASDYFEQLYDIAVRLIRKGKAYVDTLTAEEMRAYRGTLTLPGKNSPSVTVRLRRILTFFEPCAPGNSPMAPTSFERRSTWHPPISTYETRFSIASGTRNIIGQGVPGACTRPTTMRIPLGRDRGDHALHLHPGI